MKVHFFGYCLYFVATTKPKMKFKVISWIYLINGFIYLIATAIGLTETEYVSKALLMPLLIYYVYARSEGQVSIYRLFLTIGLIFSWIGDLLLLYAESSEWYFIGGLAAFLVTQIVYAASFNKATYEKLRFNAAKLLPVFILAFVMSTRIIPHTEDMMIPIIAYSIALFTMLGYAKLREELTTRSSYILSLAGGVCFVVSDGVLAYNKFVFSIPYANLIIMSTYIAAQYLITYGIMLHPQKK